MVTTAHPGGAPMPELLEHDTASQPVTSPRIRQDAVAGTGPHEFRVRHVYAYPMADQALAAAIRDHDAWARLSYIRCLYADAGWCVANGYGDIHASMAFARLDTARGIYEFEHRWVGWKVDPAHRLTGDPGWLRCATCLERRSERRMEGWRHG